MSSWTGAGTRFWGGLLVLGALCGGCGGGDSGAPAGGAGAGAPGTGLPRTEPPGLGWSIRDATPYGRMGASAVIDTTADRLIVFGGGGRDVWALALSGEHEGFWQEITPRDGVAPAQPFRSGVYDARRNRVLMLVDTLDSAQLDYADVELWSLSLDGEPHFTRLATEGEQPGAELAGGQLAIDETGDRLFAVGGANLHCGAWQLPLADGGRWSSVAKFVPDASNLCPFAGLPGLLAFDDLHHQLLAYGYTSSWALSLADLSWTPVSLPGGGYGLPPSAYDSARHQLIYPPTNMALEAGAAFDTVRDRTIYFPGNSIVSQGSSNNGGPSNETWQVKVGSLQPEPLTRDSRGAVLHDGSSVAWDATLRLGVAFGSFDYDPDETLVRDLDPAGIWHTNGAAPPLHGDGAVYDSERRAVVALANNGDQLAVFQLASKGAAQWQPLDTGTGPSERTFSVVAYDSEARRLLVRGGVHNASYGGPLLDEIWSFDLGGAGGWQQLETDGDGPGVRFQEAGAYDGTRQRLIVFGGSSDGSSDSKKQDLHALTFDGDRATWSTLEPVGAAPRLFDPHLLMDEAHGRMLFVDLEGGPVVAALDFSGETPEWHRFCSVGTPPPRAYGTTFAALVDDELFVAVGNGTFRFDLATPYCD